MSFQYIGCSAKELAAEENSYIYMETVEQGEAVL